MLFEVDKLGKTKEYGSTGGTIPILPHGLDKKHSQLVYILIHQLYVIVCYSIS